MLTKEIILQQGRAGWRLGQFGGRCWDRPIISRLAAAEPLVASTCMVFLMHDRTRRSSKVSACELSTMFLSCGRLEMLVVNRRGILSSPVHDRLVEHGRH